MDAPRIDPELTFQVGAFEGGEHETFGSVGDVGTDAGGNVFVLDVQARRLHAFGGSGDYLGLVSSSGEGPSELAQPTYLARAPDGAVEVLDPRQGRILRFKVTDDEPSWDSNVGVSTFGSAFCWTGGQRVLLTPNITDPALATLDESGEAVDAFGEPYLEDLGPELMGRYRVPALSSYNFGRMACTEEPEPRVIVLLTQVPLVRAFDLSGALSWERHIEGFTRLRHQARPGGGVVMVLDPGDDPEYSGVGIAISGDSLVVSVGVDRGEGDSHPFHALLLSVQDGRELGRIRLPFAVQRLDGDIAYGYRQYPFPEVVGFAWRDLFR